MLHWHAQQLVSARTALVVAPETAIPLLPSQLPEGYWPSLVASFPRAGTRQALVGVPLGDFEQGYTNSVIGLGAWSRPIATTSTTSCLSASSSLGAFAGSCA